MTFTRKPPPKRERTPLVRSTLPPTPAVYARVDRDRPAVARVEVKTPNRVQQSIRDSARGEECTVRIPGVCTHDPEKTIWSHAPLGAAGKGRSLKSLDLCGAYCCTACDAAIDSQAGLPAGTTRAMALHDWFMGHMRSLVKLRQKGLV